MSEQLDSVAEAICKAHHGGDFINQGEAGREIYRRMAQAAIDALQLTPVIGGQRSRSRGWRIKRRLATPWDVGENQ